MILVAPDKLGIMLAHIKDIATIGAALLAAAWFCAKWQFGRRASITVDCEFFRVEAPDTVLAEIAVRLKNVGDVRQDLYGFDMSVNALKSGLAHLQGNRELIFSRSLIPNRTIAVPDGNLRPGVEGLYTFPFSLEHSSPLVQISVAIRYHRDKEPINKVDKIFIPKPTAECDDKNARE